MVCRHNILLCVHKDDLLYMSAHRQYEIRGNTGQDLPPILTFANLSSKVAAAVHQITHPPILETPHPSSQMEGWVVMVLDSSTNGGLSASPLQPSSDHCLALVTWNTGTSI
ncbi:hypothetical protein GDO86_000158 [Hymenochirus boettgeri]|uniref:Uncharacterized protein n=1 Tax=Hymenochirus boettgeri TaxID=247094 RepID=A0A8T2KCV3_9PIPI|nr:hypothetical protein GDO86_000158 [Hymenochirus boettgeri]